MIVSIWGDKAAGFHTTSFAWRAAWARRTSHHAAVVARAVAVPARCITSRRVSIHTSSRTYSPCGAGQRWWTRARGDRDAADRCPRDWRAHGEERRRASARGERSPVCAMARPGIGEWRQRFVGALRGASPERLWHGARRVVNRVLPITLRDMGLSRARVLWRGAIERS